jgi:cyclopropane-fatty-acyl-phospholipid synthase
MDYRALKEKYDRIVSVGMFEHVGSKNYNTFFEVAGRCLHDDGLFLLHTIGTNKTENILDLWTEKYIFPNGMLPSVAQIGKSIEKSFILEDWHSFGADYDKTLMAWDKNFEKNWNKIKDKYSDRFFRMWKYFLLSSAGSFRSRRRSQLWQLVLSKKGVPGGYQAIR